MKVFITGGAGFIGSHLAERLLGDGHRVVLLDDLSTGSIDNVAHLLEHPRLTYRIGSVMDAPLVSELVDRCDVTVHLAAAVGVRLILERPVRTIETNVHGTEVVLNAVSRKNRLVVVASTSEVYGKGTRCPFREDDDLVLGPTTHSRWAYACSKALDEWLALAYHREQGTPVIVARFFNTVGPRQTGRYGMVLPNFVAQAEAGLPLTVHGTGGQTRAFIHITDTVKCVQLALENPPERGDRVKILNQMTETHRVRDLANGLAEHSPPARQANGHARFLDGGYFATPGALRDSP